MNHTELVEMAKKSISDVFRDISVDPSETYSSLKELMEEIEILIDTLPKQR